MPASSFLPPWAVRGALRPLVAALAVALGGCAALPDLPRASAAREAASFGLTGPAASVDAHWWRSLGDAQLDRLVDQALAGHPSLRVAQARLDRVRALVEVSDAALLPQVTGAVDVTRQRYTRNGAVPAPLAGSIRDSGGVNLQGSWELDLFGRSHAALASAIGQTRAAQADAEAARQLIATQVVRTYLQMARAQALEAVASRAIDQRDEALRLVRARVGAGLDSDLELRQAEAAVPEARGQREALREQVEMLRHALAALVGQPTGDPVPARADLAALRPLALPSQLPADLLGRRPDVVAARWRVEAAGQDVVQARAQFYPNVNLVALAGVSSIGLSRVFEAGSEQWSLGPAVRLPLFEGGRLRAQLRGKAADREAAVASYESTVLDAVREVADQVTSIQSIERQRQEQQQAERAAQDAYRLALARYEAGIGNLLWVLNAENAVLAQRRAGVDLAARALDAQAQLARALGGGWQEPAALAPAATATASSPETKSR